ncbi:hypothetical protein B0H17DRAFT_1089030 [Mycena rosella]|uniref:Uncharacterized protein n=1 Tax=Mycena rosella TaxID=1033263 RepID=A0AAD7D0A6_MYCRO|nr:hypothetical protein B0H17DRAFT_1089030 [Mycena rosella]
MDDEPHPDNEFEFESTTNIDGGSATYAGAFFPMSRNFVVEGGVFTSNVTNNIHQAAPAVPSDFRMIPLGDMDLRNEIRFNRQTGVVGRQSPRGCIRRMYSAKIEGRKSAMTVKIYQGDEAEEVGLHSIPPQEWRHDIGKFPTSGNHPNVIQIYAAASSRGIHAMILHDDLIPFYEIEDLYRHSHFATLQDANEYLRVTHDYEGCYQFLVRRSTGRLCANILEKVVEYPTIFISSMPHTRMPNLDNIRSLSGPNAETAVISCLTLEQYHKICSVHLDSSGHFSPSAKAAAKMGAIVASTQLHESVEVTFMLVRKSTSRWKLEHGVHAKYHDWSLDPVRYSINVWMRFSSDASFRRCNACDISLSGISLEAFWYGSPSVPWLAQANHIFTRLGITSNYDDYVLVNSIGFMVLISATLETLPEGYLFICPTEDLQPESGLFWWPDCPAYWRATLGFPTINLKTVVGGVSWDAGIYAGLRKFHEVKGFDPDSQDVAKHLGYSLYQLSSEVDIPFAHVEDEEVGIGNDESNGPVTEEGETIKAAAIAESEPVLATAHENPEAFCWQLMIAKAMLILFLTLSRVLE